MVIRDNVDYVDGLEQGPGLVISQACAIILRARTVQILSYIQSAFYPLGVTAAYSDNVFSRVFLIRGSIRGLALGETATAISNFLLTDEAANLQMIWTETSRMYGSDHYPNKVLEPERDYSLIVSLLTNVTTGDFHGNYFPALSITRDVKPYSSEDRKFALGPLKSK